MILNFYKPKNPLTGKSWHFPRFFFKEVL